MKKKLIICILILVLNQISKAQTVTDADSNIYNIVTIGSQVWMKENLKTTKYSDGTSLEDASINYGVSIGAYCDYNNVPSNSEIFGRLYNWYAVSTNMVCPSGWHAASEYDWGVLEYFLIANGYNYDNSNTVNKIGKSLASTTLWFSSINEGAVGNIDFPSKRDTTGFTALPGGARKSGVYSDMGSEAYWWSYRAGATGFQPVSTINYYYTAGLATGTFMTKTNYASVRCIKDIGTNINYINESDKIIIYPNPALERIEVTGLSKGTLEIINPQGQIVKVMIITDIKSTIDLSKLSSGLYTLRFITDKGIILKKLIKQ